MFIIRNRLTIYIHYITLAMVTLPYDLYKSFQIYCLETMMMILFVLVSTERQVAMDSFATD